VKLSLREEKREKREGEIEAEENEKDSRIGGGHACVTSQPGGPGLYKVSEAVLTARPLRQTVCDPPAGV